MEQAAPQQPARPRWKYGPPFNINKWVEENQHKLKPPVSNYMLYKEGEFQVMVLGGPNCRSDFHVECGEEWFYQMKGAMVLKIWDDGVITDIHIGEGEMFLLPGEIPHSPQRFPDTIGLVIERERAHSEAEDRLRWYCDNCAEMIYQESFHCVDLGVQLIPVIERYYADEQKRTCSKCKHVSAVPSVPGKGGPKAKVVVDSTGRHVQE